MTKLRTLLGTTALVGAGLLITAPAPAHAATVSPGGALDLTLTGFARFLASGGDLDNARLDRTVGGGLDFRNDTEVHVLARAKHDATGIEYGGTVEFEADTNNTLNTDETWVFMRGGFGEFRFGDEDGPVDNSAVGGFTVAAGTGGIDGTVIDTIATGVVKPFNSGDSTKIRYYTPTFGGFSLGVSYTPQVGSDGQDLANKATVNPDGTLGPGRPFNDLVEGALVYSGAFGGVTVLASLVGSTCDNANEADDCQTLGGGATLGLFGFKLGAGYFTQELGVGDTNQKKDFFNVGIGAGLGPVNLSVTYGAVTSSDDLVSSTGQPINEPQNLVFSADIGLMPGLVLAGDIGWFDNDAEDDLPGSLDDDGYQAVARLGLAF